MKDNVNSTVKLVMTEKELAAYLGVSYWTVRDWRLLDEDPLPTVGTGKILYRLKTVEEWMARSEERNAKAASRRKRRKAKAV